LRFGGARAFYNPSRNFIQVPPPQGHFELIGWLRTAFREIGHYP